MVPGLQFGNSESTLFHPIAHQYLSQNASRITELQARHHKGIEMSSPFLVYIDRAVERPYSRKRPIPEHSLAVDILLWHQPP